MVGWVAREVDGEEVRDPADGARRFARARALLVRRKG